MDNETQAAIQELTKAVKKLADEVEQLRLSRPLFPVDTFRVPTERPFTLPYVQIPLPDQPTYPHDPFSPYRITCTGDDPNAPVNT